MPKNNFMTSEGPRQRFFIQGSQNINNQTVEYRVVVTKAFLYEMRDLVPFKGEFNITDLKFYDPTNPNPLDWVVLNPEGLAMQLLRLAYIAAIGEEGHYGRD